MSATTASAGRPRNRTATAGGAPGRRRNERSAPGGPGGERNPGTASPSRRASPASTLAVAAKPTADPMGATLAGGCDSLGPVLSPAQQDVVELLRAPDRPRPTIERDPRPGLRRRLEEALAPLAGKLDAPLFVSKAALARIAACEAHQLAEEAAPFEWSIPTARGTIAHKAIELSVHRRDAPSPLHLVDGAFARLEADPDAGSGVGSWLATLDEAERAELRGSVNEVVGGFLELWPPLPRAWRPATEVKLRAELCDGMVILSARSDLTLGMAQGSTAGKVLVELKTGARAPRHAEDLRYAALLETLRCGVPPLRLALASLDSGTISVEDVTDEVLEAALRRTIAGATRLLELRLGLRTAAITPNPACGWCAARTTCEGAVRWASSAEDA